jgi:MoxR-like ATPase
MAIMTDTDTSQGRQTEPALREANRVVSQVIENVEEVIVGHHEEIEHVLTAMLGRGHVLLEDVPGVGKTMLARAIAASFEGEFKRVQFTPDLLPTDVTGVNVYNQQSKTFEFQPGPIFGNVVLGDEINRAPPKTQAALLEAMEEEQVTVDGETHELPDPFFVIATQNPQEQAGTFALPESQLDRFLMRLSLGYPNPAAEREILRGRAGRVKLESLPALFDAERMRVWQARLAGVHVAEALLDYVQALAAASREHPELAWGLSTRGVLALLQAARGWALLAGRDHVLPEDVQSVWVPVTGHRLSSGPREEGEALARHLLGRVSVMAG